MIPLDVYTVQARDRAYQSIEKLETGTPQVAHPERWTPPVEDIQDAAKLFAYLSPEVRRFAIAMEAQWQASAPEDLARRSVESERPRNLYRRMITEASRLFEAFSHSGVTDSLGRPRPHDHVDRNERRVSIVLKEAASLGCYLLRIAESCT